jgi:hypothetical protein
VSGDANSAPGSALRQARLRRGFKQAKAMALFAESVARQGDSVPSSDSLKRQFAYWESGARIPSRRSYQRAFMEIYQAPAEALGFAAIADTEPDDTTTQLADADRFRLHQVDEDLIALFEAQTQNLRLLDRRLGAEALTDQTRAHVAQVAKTLRRSVTGPRESLGACLAEAAALAGWQALDRQDLAQAWDMHDLARSAAREAGDIGVLAHVSAQQSCVLLDDGQPELAVQLATSARSAARSKVPALLGAWLAAAQAEALAATGDEPATLRTLESAERLLGRANDDEGLPYLMLSPGHLARWRGHCLARLGHPEAIEYLSTALADAGDSVRAATGLQADLALTLQRAGQVAEARQHAVVAVRMAERCGSARQRRRLRDVLAATGG